MTTDEKLELDYFECLELIYAHARAPIFGDDCWRLGALRRKRDEEEIAGLIHHKRN